MSEKGMEKGKNSSLKDERKRNGEREEQFAQG
jgi:hypothetical protein